RFARLDRAGEPGKARHGVARLETQVEEASARAVMLGRGELALPFEAHVGELAARLELEGEPPQAGRQRQRVREMRERRELERVGTRHAAFVFPYELEV